MQDLHITQSTELFTGPTCKNTHWCKIKVALINTYYTYQHQLLSLKKNMLKTEWMFELFWRRRVTACNKITDAGVCKEHSGSTRILFQEATETQKADFTDQVKILTGRHLRVCVWYRIAENCFLPVCEVVFVQVHESRGDVTSHPLKNQGLRGHGFCSPAASEVTLHIPLEDRGEK